MLTKLQLLCSLVSGRALAEDDEACADSDSIGGTASASSGPTIATGCATLAPSAALTDAPEGPNAVSDDTPLSFLAFSGGECALFLSRLIDAASACAVDPSGASVGRRVPSLFPPGRCRQTRHAMDEYGLLSVTSREPIQPMECKVTYTESTRARATNCSAQKR
jgi:hypothetical protein